MRDTQQRALAGNAKARRVTEATAAERETIRALLTAARRHFGAPRHVGPPGQACPQTLRAAAVDPRAPRTLLERGRLTEELQAVGFGPLEAVKPAARQARRGRAAQLANEFQPCARKARRLSAEAQDAEPASRRRRSRRWTRYARGGEGEARRRRARVANELAEAEDSLRDRR